MNTSNLISTALGALVFGCVATAQPALPSAFKSRTVTSPDGASIFVRSAGAGPVVVLLHGYAATSDSWALWQLNWSRATRSLFLTFAVSENPLARQAVTTRQASDIRAVVTTLGLDRASVVSHDIGIMVAYAYAARYPDKVERLVVMDAPIPGIAPRDDIVKNPALWHFSFNGPDAERLVPAA